MKVIVIPVTEYMQNCSLLICESTGKAAVVDPGGDLERITQALEKQGAELAKIFLTHGHMDHCAGADALRKLFDVPIEGPHEADRFWIDNLPAWTAQVGFPHTEAFEPNRWLEDGETVSFGDVTLEVLHCPGHTPGHVVFYAPQQRFAIVGDVLFQGAIGRTDFPKGDYDTLIQAIQTKLWPLGDDVTFLPGHGPTSTFGEERRSNPFVADKRYS